MYINILIVNINNDNLIFIQVILLVGGWGEVWWINQEWGWINFWKYDLVMDISGYDDLICIDRYMQIQKDISRL